MYKVGTSLSPRLKVPSPMVGQFRYATLCCSQFGVAVVGCVCQASGEDGALSTRSITINKSITV